VRGPLNQANTLEAIEVMVTSTEVEKVFPNTDLMVISMAMEKNILEKGRSPKIKRVNLKVRKIIFIYTFI